MRSRGCDIASDVTCEAADAAVHGSRRAYAGQRHHGQGAAIVSRVRVWACPRSHTVLFAIMGEGVELALIQESTAAYYRLEEPVN